MATKDELMGLLDQIIEQYKPGGGFKEAGLAEIARRKERTVGKQTQSLVGAGLGGTSQAAVLGSRFEEEVGTPARTQLEHERVGALTKAMGAKAGYLEREAAREEEERRARISQALRQEQIALQGAGQERQWLMGQNRLAQAQRQFETSRSAGFGADTGGGTGGGLTTHTGIGDSIFGGGGTFGGGGVSFSAPGGGGGGVSGPSIGEMGEFAQGWLGEGYEGFGEYSPVGADQKPLTSLQETMFEAGYGPVSEQGAKDISMQQINEQYKDWLSRTGRSHSHSQWMSWGEKNYPSRFGG